jgi:sugar-specific transcriptional regulator TrmB
MVQERQTQAVELLQDLGLKEYEAKCVVALVRMPHATAKEISEVTDVPRTRVYDAARVLEAKGLVEVQHCSPRRYRAVSIDEATALLSREYESRVSTLTETLKGLPDAEEETADSPPVGEIWSINNHEAITTRSLRLIEDATDEVVLVVGDSRTVTEDVFDALSDAADRGVHVIVGTMDEDLERVVRDAVPTAEVFVSNLSWLPVKSGSSETTVTRLLLVDERTIVVGSRPAAGMPEEAEQAVVGNGTSNGIVVILRHLLRSGLLEGKKE